MPTLTAERRSACAACGAPILQGERVDHTREHGTRHLACTDRAPQYRTNRYAVDCCRCGRRLRAGEGSLALAYEARVDGAWLRRWAASCRGACLTREDGRNE